TQTLPPSVSAARTASSTENAGMPRGVGTSKRRKTSLPWYSWIFTRASSSSGGAPVPLRIVTAHGLGGGLQRMTAIELERLGFAGLDPAPQSREHLDRGRRQMRQQLGDVTASTHATHRVVEGLAESMQQADSNELRVRALDAIACIGIRHL